MHALLHLLGREYTQWEHVNCIKQVDCSQCALTYYYPLTRSAQGHAFSWFHLFNRQAEQKAIQRSLEAAADLAKHEAELVPCPNCGHISPQQIRAYARRIALPRTIALTATTLGLLAGVFAGVAAEYFLQARFNLPQGLLAVIFFILGSMSALWLWLFQRIRRAAFNPSKAGRRGRRALPLGTPPAMLLDTDAQGQVWLETVIDQHHLAMLSQEGVLLSPLMPVDMPPRCCVCMKPASPRDPATQKSLKGFVPRCHDCTRRNRRSTCIAYTLAILATLIALAAALVIFHLLGKLTPPAVSGAICGGVVIGAASCDLLDRYFLSPCRVNLVDQRRQIYRFKAKNADFNLLLLTQQMTPQRIAWSRVKEMLIP